MSKDMESKRTSGLPENWNWAAGTGHCRKEFFGLRCSYQSKANWLISQATV